MTFEDDINEINNLSVDTQEFEIWLTNGIERGWVSKPFCNTHEGDPYMSEEEEKEWDQGGDPCQVVIKLKGM